VGIVGFAQLGRDVQSLDEAKEYFELIESDAGRANGILQNLLEFARPQKVEQEQLELNAVVQASVRLVAHQLQLLGVKLSTQLAPELPMIEGDSNMLRQVLINLMMNAAQAMELSPTRELHVATAATAQGVKIDVRDTGPGMSPEVCQRIFQPFFSTKPKGKGTGLGLSVSSSIIAQHRGALSVASEVGKGATFTIALPAAAAPSVIVAANDDGKAKAG
jgi:two-component system NtrC family sensor kinase